MPGLLPYEVLTQRRCLGRRRLKAPLLAGFLPLEGPRRPWLGRVSPQSLDGPTLSLHVVAWHEGARDCNKMAGKWSFETSLVESVRSSLFALGTDKQCAPTIYKKLEKEYRQESKCNDKPLRNVRLVYIVQTQMLMSWSQTSCSGLAEYVQTRMRACICSMLVRRTCDETNQRIPSVQGGVVRLPL